MSRMGCSRWFFGQHVHVAVRGTLHRGSSPAHPLPALPVRSEGLEQRAHTRRRVAHGRVVRSGAVPGAPTTRCLPAGTNQSGWRSPHRSRWNHAPQVPAVYASRVVPRPRWSGCPYVDRARAQAGLDAVRAIATCSAGLGSTSSMTNGSVLNSWVFGQVAPRRMNPGPTLAGHASCLGHAVVVVSVGSRRR